MFAEFSNAQVRAELGRRLRSHRRGRRLTQEALAVAAGISRPTLSKLERGHDVSLDSLLATLRALNLLDGLELAVSAPADSPIAALGGPTTEGSSTAWTWGDEQ